MKPPVPPSPNDAFGPCGALALALLKMEIAASRNASPRTGSAHFSTTCARL